MKYGFRLTSVLTLPVLLLFAVDSRGGPGAVDTSKSPHVKLRSVSPADVRWTTGFWADRFELCRKSMLPTLHNTLLDPKCSAQLNRIRFTAGLQDKNPGGVDWADGDCYKWTENAKLKLNGRKFSGAIKPGAYAKISRKWNPGDIIELDLPMPIRLMAANPKVRNLRDKVAVMRGPLVYCLELPKSEGGEKVWNDGVFLPENVELSPEHRKGFLGGVTVLKGKALTHKGRVKFVKDTSGAATSKTSADWGEMLYRPLVPRSLKYPGDGLVEISLIPYYAWANRGLAMMEVWIPLAR
ncbi:MAG: glycoside hydrolase family 127 protein [Phycisphaerae bacterium]|nr:glycoside hydrolase family 127 protein [Phycisphaerae bacterium]